jgi:hypothetical protein
MGARNPDRLPVTGMLAVPRPVLRLASAVPPLAAAQRRAGRGSAAARRGRAAGAPDARAAARAGRGHVAAFGHDVPRSVTPTAR